MVVLDLLDIPSAIGINVSSINMDLLGVLVQVFIAFCLFVLTYFLIDRWQIRRNNNRQEAAKVLLYSTYCECLATIDLFEQHGEVVVHAASCSESKVEAGAAEKSAYADEPFKSYELIMQLCTDGVITKEQLDEYIEIKGLFQSIIPLFYLPDDNDSFVKMKTASAELLKERINKAKKTNAC